MSKGWGKIMLGVRLEKMVEAPFIRSWANLLTSGMRPGDRWEMTEGLPAHSAANALVRQLLHSDCDSILMVDSDGDFEKDFIHQMRDHEPGFDFDVLQAFYIRRGWPPQAIWFKRDESGTLHNCLIFGDITEEVALVGTHCVLIRREVFEKMLGDNDPELYHWFYYPRHQQMTEDAAFSFDAIDAGFRLGATSHVKVNHLSHLSVGWDTYQEYLQTSGQAEQLDRFDNLTKLVCNFTGETPEVVIQKATSGNKNVKKLWEEMKPTTAGEVVDFYNRPEYLYDLLHWNCTLDYLRITKPLESYKDKKALVIGAGLGSEAALLAENNKVDVFELPGVLRDFCKTRLNGSVHYLDNSALTELDRKYDLIVAIDTVEHFHPDEFDGIMSAINRALLPGGELYCHNNFSQQDLYPMHFDNEERFGAWANENGIKQVNDLTWIKEK